MGVTTRRSEGRRQRRSTLIGKRPHLSIVCTLRAWALKNWSSGSGDSMLSRNGTCVSIGIGKERKNLVDEQPRLVGDRGESGDYK